MRNRVLSVGLLAAAVVAVGCTRVDPGHVGIKVSMAGTDRGVSEYTATTGWVFYNPFFSKVFEYPVNVQTAVWTKNPGEGHPLNEEIVFTNKDQMSISVDANLSYHLEREKVPAFYVKFRNDDIEDFTYGYLHNTARDIFNQHAGRYSIEQIMGDNSAFLKDVRDSLQKEVGPLGVVIDQFGIIGAPRPPQAVIDAINAKVHAVQLAQQKQNEVVQAEADARKAVAEAEGQAQSILKVAEAQAQANKKLSESITPTLVQYKALEKWTGTLPQVTAGAVPFINVGPR